MSDITCYFSNSFNYSQCLKLSMQATVLLVFQKTCSNNSSSKHLPLSCLQAQNLPLAGTQRFLLTTAVSQVSVVYVCFIVSL